MSQAHPEVNPETITWTPDVIQTNTEMTVQYRGVPGSMISFTSCFDQGFEAYNCRFEKEAVVQSNGLATATFLPHSSVSQISVKQISSTGHTTLATKDVQVSGGPSLDFILTFIPTIILGAIIFFVVKFVSGKLKTVS